MTSYTITFRVNVGEDVDPSDILETAQGCRMTVLAWLEQEDDGDEGSVCVEETADVDAARVNAAYTESLVEGLEAQVTEQHAVNRRLRERLRGARILAGRAADCLRTLQQVSLGADK